MKKIFYVLAQVIVTVALLFGMIRLLNHRAFAADPKTLESDYTPMKFSAITSVASATFSVTGVGTSYKIYVGTQGAGNPDSASWGSYHINWTTDTLKDFKTNISTLIVAASSETYFPARQYLWDEFHILNVNPQFVFSNLTTNATLYFELDYGQQRLK